MAEDAATIGVLRLSVGSDGMIRIRERPQGFTAPDQRIRFDPQNDALAAETIETLIDMARRNRLTDHEEYKLLGAHLYSVLLDNRIGEDLTRVMLDAHIKLVRVVLEFEDQQYMLASWPWEYLFCPPRLGIGGSGYFLSRQTRLVLIRNLPSEFPPHLTVEAPPVKVLFVASQPNGMALSYQSVLETLRDLSENDDDGGQDGAQAMELRVIEPTTVDPDSGLPLAAATYRKMIDTAASFEPHMIHIVAHGHRIRGRGEVAFMAAGREVDWVSEDNIASDLSRMALPSLRFVFLEACESALPGSDSLRGHHAAVSGVAMRLAHAGIPAVVGMQYQIEQGSANLFTREFYKALLDRETVDVAVLRGRRELKWADLERPRENGDGQQAVTRPGFGLPVLYLQEQGALFPPRAQRPDLHAEPLGPSAPAFAAARQADDPSPPTACPRCDDPCDKSDKFCDRCENYLKCPRCRWPVIRARSKCANCMMPLEIAGVPLNPPRGVRAAPPAAGEDASWG
jgi:hypothetical protein